MVVVKVPGIVVPDGTLGPGAQRGNHNKQVADLALKPYYDAGASNAGCIARYHRNLRLTTSPPNLTAIPTAQILQCTRHTHYRWCTYCILKEHKQNAKRYDPWIQLRGDGKLKNIRPNSNNEKTKHRSITSARNKTKIQQRHKDGTTKDKPYRRTAILRHIHGRMRNRPSKYNGWCRNMFLSPIFQTFIKQKEKIVLKHRIMAVHASNRDHSLFFTTAYCPGEDRPAEEKTTFWKTLHHFIAQLSKKHTIILSIDTNGHIGSDPPIPYIATGGSAKWTSNGHAFADLCLSQQLHATNAMSTCSNTGPTWTKRGPIKTQHRLDYICVNMKAITITTNNGAVSAKPWMMQGAAIDHNPVQVAISAKAYCIKYNQPYNKQKRQTLKYSKTSLK